MLLHVLWGMFFGYIIASVNYASILVRKGYRTLSEIPDKDCDDN
jgi:hypothetical protein